MEDRHKNVQVCINYVFDYYFKYLEENTDKALSSKKQFNLGKIKDILEHKFKSDISSWLIDVYDKYQKRLDIQIEHFIDSSEEFPLCYCEKDFQTLTDMFCKKNRMSMPFLSDYQSNIQDFIKYLFAKEDAESHKDFEIFKQTEPAIYDWLVEVYNKYSVNLRSFAWKTILNVDYETKQKYFRDSKLKDQLPLAVEPLFEKYKSKPFLSGKKEEFEIVFRIEWQEWVRREPEMEAVAQHIIDRMKQKENK